MQAPGMLVVHQGSVTAVDCRKITNTTQIVTEW